MVVSNLVGSVTNAEPVVLTVAAGAPAGGVVAWGNNDSGQATTPAAAFSDVTAIAGGAGIALALLRRRKG